MTDGKMLTELVKASGITITHMATTMGCSRNRIYAIMAGSDCKVSEAHAISDILHLSKAEEQRIFFTK